MIYVLQIEDHKYIKVGYTGNPDVSGRVATLQTGCPYEIQPVMTVEGSLMEEKLLHAELGGALAMLNLPVPPNEWYPGRHFFTRLVLTELRFGAATAIAFIRAYTQTKRGGALERKPARHAWTPGRVKSVVMSPAFQAKQENVVRSLPNGSSASLLHKRQEQQDKAAQYRSTAGKR